MAGNISRGFGIDLDTTAFLMLEAAAVASGNTIVTRTPDGRPLPPAFNMALISKGAGFPRGALTMLLGPVTDIVLRAADMERHRGARATRNALEAALTSRREILARLEKHEAELRTAKSKNAKADSLVEQVLNGGRIDDGAIKQARADGFDFERADMLRIKIATDRKALDNAEAEVSVLQLAAAPGILADEPDWSSIGDLSQRAFDQSVLAVSFSSLGHLPLVTRKRMPGMARALMRTDLGKPGVNVIACGTAEVFAQVLATPAVREAGIFSTFAFVETTEPGTCDPGAIEAAGDDETWTRLCKSLFVKRMGGTQKVLLPDHEGLQVYAAFRAWCRQECPPALRAYFECWPDLCLHFALGRAILMGADSVAADYIQRAAEYLKSRLAATVLLIESLTTGETPEQQRQSRIDRVCRRLKNGPLTKRGIARTMHRQDYGVVEGMIDEAMHAGRIERRGDFFYPLNVSVSAAAASS